MKDITTGITVYRQAKSVIYVNKFSDFIPHTRTAEHSPDPYFK